MSINSWNQEDFIEQFCDKNDNSSGDAYNNRKLVSAKLRESQGSHISLGGCGKSIRIQTE